MTTKEIYELSGAIYGRLSDYHQEIASAIITCMNERGVDEIDLRKAREDCNKKGLPDVAKRLEDIANDHIVDIFYKDGETLSCYIDRVIILDMGFVYCVCSGVQDPGVEITENVRTLNIYAAISVMELVTEYFDAMGEIASKQ